MIKKISSVILAAFSFAFAAEIESTFVAPPWGHTWGVRRAGDYELKLRYNDLAFKRPEGLSVTRLIASDDPRTSDDDLYVTVYGVNAGMNMVIYNTSMYTLGRYGRKGRAVGELNNPRGVYGNEHGDVYICDSGNQRVVKLYNNVVELQRRVSEKSKNLELNEADGFMGLIKIFLDFSSVPGSTNTLEERGYIGGDWIFPYAVSGISDGTVFITDYGAGCVRMFDANGTELRRINVDKPTGIVARDKGERWNVRNMRPQLFPENIARDYFAVICENGTRISVYDFSGTRIHTKSTADLGVTNARFNYIEGDYYNNFIVSDTAFSRLHKFTPELEYITAFGSYGKGENQFNGPTGVAMYRRFGMFFVAEQTGAQYFWVGADIKNLSVVPTREGIECAFLLTEASDISVTLYRGAGNARHAIARKPIQNQRVYATNPKIVIPAEALLNAGFTNGMNVEFEISVTPTYSSKDKFFKRITTNATVILPERVDEE